MHAGELQAGRHLAAARKPAQLVEERTPAGPAAGQSLALERRAVAQSPAAEHPGVDRSPALERRAADQNPAGPLRERRAVAQNLAQRLAGPAHQRKEEQPPTWCP